MFVKDLVRFLVKTNMYNTITRTDNNTIDTKFTHLSFIGLNELVMDEKYTMM